MRLNNLVDRERAKELFVPSPHGPFSHTVSREEENGGEENVQVLMERRCAEGIWCGITQTAIISSLEHIAIILATRKELRQGI